MNGSRGWCTPVRSSTRCSGVAWSATRCGTRSSRSGVVSPRVVIRTSFAQELDDEALIAVLHHELERVVGHNPLRFVAWWALAINPFKWILNGELARWVLARGIHCNSEAVAGASAPALAHSLVRGSRAAPGRPVPALGTRNLATLRLRVDLLLAYADSPPMRCCRGPALRIVVGLLVIVAAFHAAPPPGS